MREVQGPRLSRHGRCRRRASDLDLAIFAPEATPLEWADLCEALENAPVIYELDCGRTNDKRPVEIKDSAGGRCDLSGGKCGGLRRGLEMGCGAWFTGRLNPCLAFRNYGGSNGIVPALGGSRAAGLWGNRLFGRFRNDPRFCWRDAVTGRAGRPALPVKTSTQAGARFRKNR